MFTFIFETVIRDSLINTNFLRVLYHTTLLVIKVFLPDNLKIKLNRFNPNIVVTFFVTGR